MLLEAIYKETGIQVIPSSEGEREGERERGERERREREV